MREGPNLLSVMIDLDETQRMKRLLQENPENFDEIIEDTFLGICITDENGNFVAVNEAYCLMYGYSREELVGNPFVMVLEESQRDKLQELHDLFMKFKDEIMRNWRVQRKDGSQIHIFADAGYSDVIQNRPRKVTLVWPDVPELQEAMYSLQARPKVN